MKFLSPQDTKEWLLSFNVTVASNRTLQFPSLKHKAAKKIVMEFPSKPIKLTYFLERVVDWLPRGRERLLLLSDWNTYPPHPLAFFENIRQGCGEERHIIDAPGLLIESDEGPTCQEFSESPNTAILVGFALLVVTFEWQAYLVSEQETTHVYLGDEFMCFSTESETKLAEVYALAHRFGLKVR